MGEGVGEMACGVDGRPADGLQSHAARKALCGSCDAGDGERIPAGDSATGVARDCGDVESRLAIRPGTESQPGQGATELSSAGGDAVRRRAERVVRPRARRLRVLVITVARPDQSAPGWRARLCAIWTASQAPLAAKRADGMWFPSRT